MTSPVDALWQRLKATAGPSAMAGSRFSASSALPARVDTDAAAVAALDGGAAGSADLAARTTARNEGETVRLREARVELILTQRLRQRPGESAQSASSGCAEKRTVPEWVWDLGLKALPTASPGAAAAGGGARGATGGGDRVKVAEAARDGEERDGGNMVKGDGGRGGGEGNEGRMGVADVAGVGERAAASAGRAAAAAAALRVAQTAASGAIEDDSRVQVREVADFAGERVEVVREVHAGSKAAVAAKRKADMQASTSKGLDALLAQMEKKKKLNILDKSRKDWSEYKEGTGVAVELAEYRKSGGTYSEKQAFLGQADVREYERERDAKLAAQARRAR